jgi:hypothetical protein
MGFFLNTNKTGGGHLKPKWHISRCSMHRPSSLSSTAASHQWGTASKAARPSAPRSTCPGVVARGAYCCGEPYMGSILYYMVYGIYMDLSCLY